MDQIMTALGRLPRWSVMVAALVVWTPLEGAQWELTDGPYGGRVYDLLATPDGTLYVGLADSDGVYRSDDNGETWRNLDIPQLEHGAKGLAYGAGRLYAHGYFGRVAVSTDRGESWAPLYPPDGCSYLAANDLALFSVLTQDWGSTLYRSLDGGENWTRVFHLQRRAYVGPLAFQGQDIYLGSSHGLFRTSDMGDTWTEALSSHPIVDLLTTSGTITIAEWRVGIRRAADPVVGWDRVDNDTRLRNPSAVARLNGVLYVGTSGPQRGQATAGVLRQRAPLWDEANEGLTDLYITDLVTTDAGLFAATNSDGVFRSVDGVTWQSVSQGLAHLGRWVEVADGALYAGGFRSDDGGATWSKRAFRPPFVAFASHLSHGGVHYVARQYAGGVWVSIDDGRSWQRVEAAGEADRLALLAVSGDAHALLTDEGLVLSVDGGRSSLPAGDPAAVSGASFLGYSMGALHVGFKDGGVRRSNDNGATWEKLPDAPPADAAIRDRTVWAVVAVGDRLLAATLSGLRAYTPGAETWEAATTQRPDLDKLIPGPDGVLYASASDRVVASTDAGRTWNPVGPSLGVSRVDSLAELNARVYAGTRAGLFHIRPETPTVEAFPEIAIVSPSGAAILAAGSESVPLVLDLAGYEGPWQWWLDAEFPYSGVAGGTRVYGPDAVVEGLVPGRMHTIHVTPTTSDGVVAFPGLVCAVAVYVPPAAWAVAGDIGATRISARHLGRAVVMTPDGSVVGEIDISETAGRVEGAAAWSPDGRELLLSAEPHLPKYAPPGLFRVDIATGEHIQLTTNDVTDEWPTWSPDGGRVAYISHRFLPSSRYGVSLHVMELPTGQSSLVAPDSAIVTAPSWSPDGSQLAYISDHHVWIARADGSDAHRLFDGEMFSSRVAWSPDGARLAVVRGGQVQVANLDGTQMTRLTSSDGWVGHCSWAPDASRIAFEGFGPDGRGVYVMNADGTDLTLILLDGHQPSWSPFISEAPRPTLTITTPDAGRTALLNASEDATRIRVTMRNHEAGWNWRVDEPFPLTGPAGGQHVAGREATVTGLRAGETHTIYATLVDASGDVLTPTVLAVATVRVPAPDAGVLDDTRIAYQAGQAVYTVRADGLDPRRITDAASTGGVWSPDGASVAFVETVDEGAALVVADPDGEGRRVVYTAPELRDPSWSPDGSGVLVATESAILAVDLLTGVVTAVTQTARPYLSPQWSPDGVTVATVAHGRVYLVGTTGAEERIAGPRLRSVESFSWAPDGAALAVGAQGGVHVVSVDDLIASRLVDGSGPRWSPDGRSIAYRTPEGGVTRHDVASGATDVIVPPNHGHAIGDIAWSPDGSALVFVDTYIERSTYLYIVNVEDGERRMLSDGPQSGSDLAWSAAPPARTASLTVRAPEAGVILPPGTLSTSLLVDGDGDWAWTLDSLFPTRGIVTENLGGPDGATIDSLLSGYTHTLRVAALDENGRLIRPLDVTTVRFSVAMRQDANSDGVVDILDLAFVGAHFGESRPFANGAPDVDEDGEVTVADLILAAARFGQRLEGMPTAAPAAPSRRHAADLGRWTRAAERVEATTPEMRKGIATLRALLASVAPSETALLPNFPNPFNPETWIPFDLAEPADVSLRLYDTRGLLVRSIDLGRLDVGAYRDRANAGYWDGRSDTGESVASGVYILELRAGDTRETRRLTVRK